MGRHLWFDELFTYYIAGEPGVARLMDAIIRVDMNPPLSYFVVRWIQDLFGRSEIVTRLPFAVGFWAGSLGVFFSLRRRIGACWSAAAILLFWSSPYIRNASQARPYGLLLAFFALTLISFDHAGRVGRTRRSVFGIAAGNVGMMLSHVFAPLSILPFCVAEATRCIVRRRVDWPVWAALLLPVTISLAYLPAIRMYQHNYYPPAYQASGFSLLVFILRLVVFEMHRPLAIGSVLALVALPFSAKRAVGIRTGCPGLVWAAAFMAVPGILMMLLMRTGGAFGDRYCLTTALCFYVLVVAIMARVAGFRRSSALAAALTFAFFALRQPYLADDAPPDAAELSMAGQQLPLVAASGLTFMEMDRYNELQLQSRLYYLTDRNAAIRYAHATIFENMPLVKQVFPIHSNVSPYSTFVASHRHFWVITRPAYLEDWLVRKLRDDGARLSLAASALGPTKDFLFYEVQWDGEQVR